ncbi:MAG: LamG domain-containing protein [Candidatus Heimdallarchaeota archaeon]
MKSSKLIQILGIFSLLFFIVLGNAMISPSKSLAKRQTNIDTDSDNTTGGWRTTTMDNINFPSSKEDDLKDFRDRSSGKRDSSTNGRNYLQDQPNHDDLVFLHHLDEGIGTTVYDSTAHGHENVADSDRFPIWLNDSEQGMGLDFEKSFWEGFGHYVNLGDDDAFSFEDKDGNDQDFSISLWIKPETENDPEHLAIISKYQGIQGWREWVLQITDTQAIQFRLFEPGGDQIGINGTDYIEKDVWKHIVVTYDGLKHPSGLSLYIDGSQRDTVPFTRGEYEGMNNTNANLLLGGYESGRDAPFDGMIDEVSLWKRQLTASEVSYLNVNKPLSLEVPQSESSSEPITQISGFQMPFTLLALNIGFLGGRVIKAKYARDQFQRDEKLPHGFF